ncbi:MAG: hypothetical protein KGH84_07675 [Paracoccaceae bacterium]|nr:hypothetical protein [Paracoccaceae bacterium]
MDTFRDYPTTPTSPIHDAIAVTPSDTASLTVTTRALYVGQSGDVALLTAGGQSVTFTAVPAGSILPLRAAKILATGTTAGAILALW